MVIWSLILLATQVSGITYEVVGPQVAIGPLVVIGCLVTLILAKFLLKRVMFLYKVINQHLRGNVSLNNSFV